MGIAHNQKIGQIGENMAVKHLVKHKFKILDRNYRKKWGEIDIIAQKKNVIHFIEVKSVSLETFVLKKNSFLLTPEENIHFWKRKRLSRAIKTYLAEKKVSSETMFQVDMIAVFVNLNEMKARIRFTENIIL